MATKNIARTAIEGGRTKWNKNERRLSNRYERRDVRRVMRKITADPEIADGGILPKREPLPKDFDDKLSAPWRWLAKKGVGKTADEIRGMLLKRFDTRTLPGRHIVFGHLMPRYDIRAVLKAQIYLRYAKYNFDENEVLREGLVDSVFFTEPKIRRQARAWQQTIDPRLRIGRRNQSYFWFIAQKQTQITSCTERYCKNRDRHDYRFNYTTSAYESVHIVPIYIQDRELTAREERLFLALDEWTEQGLDVDEYP